MVQHVSLPPSDAIVDGPDVKTSSAPASEAAHSYSDDNTRRADRDVLTQSHGQSITIRPCPISIYDKPVTLTPLRLISRSQLPLSFLDSRSDAGSAFPSTRLFTGRIELLDNGSDSSQSRVLIVNITGQAALWAVEAVGQCTFALCKLGDWVTVEHFDKQAVRHDTLLRHAAQSRPQVVPDTWWGSVAVKRKSDVLGTQTSGHVKRLKLSVLKQSGSDGQLKHVKGVATAVGTEKHSMTPAIQEHVESIIEEQVHIPSAEEVLDTLVRQYLEALYTTRASLAFFAKAPLSRARAAFSTSNQDHTISDLAVFLRSMIMKIDQMGKKYREILPEMIKQLPAVSVSDDETNRPTKKKSRKVKKPKLGKSGVYGFEHEFIRRWWFGAASHVQTVDPSEPAEKRLKRQLAELQTRETLAQIILILEVLALETSIEKSIRTAPDDPQTIEDAVITRPVLVRTTSKKPQDLQTLLELLMDKLSIWQSVDTASDFGLEDQDKKDKESTAKPIDRNGLATFCTEVVVPFYKARLPKQASLVNQKLGGTSKSSSSSSSRPSMGRRKSSKLGETTSKSSKASSSTRPNNPSSLQKQVSDSQMLSRHRSLTRSATDSLLDPPLPRLKRESSEMSMSSIPLNEKSARASREPSVHLRHLNRRQIDLNAIAAATDAKIKAKAEADNELRNAIDALKKPNRVLANREYANETDLRKQQALKRPNGPRRISSKKSGVQVGATPSHVRTADFLAKGVVEGSTSAGAVTSSPFDRVPMSTPAVPNSMSKSTVRPTLAATKAPSGFSQPVFSSRSNEVISATPSRGPAGRHADFLSQPSSTLHPTNAIGISKAEALMDRAMNRPVFAIPSSTRKPTAAMAMPSPYLYEEDVDTVAATPSAGPSTMADYFSTPSKRAKAVRVDRPGGMQSSILESPARPVRDPAAVGQAGTGATLHIDATPQKSIAPMMTGSEGSKKNTIAPGGDSKGASIYDALGWDDADGVDF